MKTVTVDTRIDREGFWRCKAELPIIGKVVIGSGRTEFQAQHEAAKFLNTNYPNIAALWVGGYHGGDTSKKSIVVPSDYWGE